MKRFAAAAAIAVGVHILLLTQDLDRGGSRPPRPPAPEAVTVLLNPPPPRVAEPRRLSPPPESPLPASVRPPTPAAVAPTAPPAAPVAAARPVKAAKKPAPAARPAAPQISDRPPPAPVAPVPAEEPGPVQDRRASAPPVTTTGPSSAPAAPAEPVEPSPGVPVLEEAKPEYGKNPALEYPRRARQLGYEGVVVLEVLVNQTGRAEAVRLFSSSGHAILDESAVRSVTAWVFKPARRGDQTISMWVRVPIRYALAPHGTRGP